MLLIIIGIISILLATINPSLLLRVLFILSLALPTSNGTTHAFSILVGTYHLLYTDVLVLMLVVTWVIKKLSKKVKQEPSNIRKFKNILFLFITWGLVGVLVGLLQSFNLNQIVYDSRPIFYYLIIFVVIDLCKSEQGLVNITKDIILGLIFYCIITLSFVILTTSHPLFDILQEVFYGFQGRIVFANDFYFLIALPLLIFMFRKFRLNSILKFLILVIIMTFIVKVVVTMSRTLIVLAFLSVFISITASVANIEKSKSFRKKVIPIILITVTIISLAIVTVTYGIPFLFGDDSSAFLSTIYGRFANYNDSQWQAAHVAPRTAMYLTGIIEALGSPIWGHGYGYMFTIDSPEWSGKLISFVDSSLITLWIRGGLIGVMILLTLIVKYYRILSYAINDSSINIYIRALYISMLGGGFCFMIIALTNSLVVNSTAILPLLIIVGATLGYWKRKLINTNNLVN